MRLIFFFLLISFCAFSQKTPATLISENDATTYSAPFRIRNAFNDQILSNVNQRTPVFLDSADITKRIKFYLNGSHPTATTYNVTLPNKSGTVAFLDDIVGGGGISKAGNGIILADADSVVADTVKMAQKSDLSGWLTGTLTGDAIVYGNSLLYSNQLAPAQSAGYVGVYDDGGTEHTAFIGYAPDDAGGNAINFNFGVSSGWTGIKAIFDDQRATKTGIEYAASGYETTSLSLTSKGYVDTALSLKITDPMTTAGDIIYKSKGLAPARLGIGTTGQVLTVSGSGLPSWAAQSTALSNITAATGSNTINSGANHQIWDWDALTSGTGISFRSASTGGASNTLKVVSIEKSGANATSSQTTTALNVSNTSTGTSSTNIGGYFTASGGTNNYAIRTLGTAQFNSSGTTTGVLMSAYSGGVENTLKFALLDNGNIGIGNINTSLTLARLLVRGSGAASIFRAENSSSVQRFVINDDGSVVNNGTSFVIGNTSITSGSNFDVNGSGIFSGSNRYLNFGTTAGSSGYGIRDNAGTMEFKNSGETWTPLGYLQPQEESGTSLTLDDLDITQGIYTSNGSAVTITVPSDLPTGAVVTIMQEGAGAVSLSAGANVNIAGKTSTTGANDFIWLWLYKKDGGTSYYVGRD